MGFWGEKWIGDILGSEKEKGKVKFRFHLPVRILFINNFYVENIHVQVIGAKASSKASIAAHPP